MALFVVEHAGQCSEAVMKEQPSEISAVPGSSKVTHWGFGCLSSALLLCSSGCTRSGPGSSWQTVHVFDGDETRLINWSGVGASIATNISKLSLVAALNKKAIVLKDEKSKRKKKSSIQV